MMRVEHGAAKRPGEWGYGRDGHMVRTTCLVIATLAAGTASTLANERTDSAARQIMALASFAEKRCPNMRVDMAGLTRFLVKMGADAERLTTASSDDQDRELVASLERLQDRPEQMCKAVWKRVSGIRFPDGTN
jgi:hypothetical protein